MFLRLRTVRSKSSSRPDYCYADVVESFRREDGRPCHRVVFSFGRVDPERGALLRDVIKAALDPDSPMPVLQTGGLPELERVRVVDNLRYLDVAVALELAKRWDVGAILARLGDRVGEDARWSEVIMALVVQRCVAPGSKLLAQRWYPKTALPKLLSVPAERFNNTRLHRALERLDEVGDQLQAALVRRYEQDEGRAAADGPVEAPGAGDGAAGCEGGFVALFGDITDTWFEGKGGGAVREGLDKEGVWRARIGVGLVCTELGLPVRWEMLPGDYHDGEELVSMLEDLAGERWARGVPVVCDRAVGCEARVRRMYDAGISFVTAAPSNEFAKYLGDLKLPTLPALGNMAGEEGEGDEDPGIEPARVAHQSQAKAVQAEAAQAALALGMQEAGSGIYVLDLGVQGLGTPEEARRACEEAPLPPAVFAMQHAHRLQAVRQESPDLSLRALARRIGVSGHAYVKKLLRLLTLSPSVQQAVLDRRADGVSVADLIRLADAHLDADTQQRRFGQLRDAKRHRQYRASGGRKTRPALAVRATLTFSPRLFWDKRRLAERRLALLLRRISALNDGPGAGRETSLRRKAQRLVDKASMNHVVRLHILSGDDHPSPTISASVDPAAWQHARRADGFNIILAHPDLPHTAQALCHLYRSREGIERDFRTIKGTVQLRPIWHRTDPKIRAHISLCMLALLVCRTLERCLAHAGIPMSADRAFETLRDCHLNRLETSPGATHLHSLTATTPDQRRILRALHLQHLIRLRPGSTTGRA